MLLDLGGVGLGVDGLELGGLGGLDNLPVGEGEGLSLLGKGLLAVSTCLVETSWADSYLDRLVFKSLVNGDIVENCTNRHNTRSATGGTIGMGATKFALFTTFISQERGNKDKDEEGLRNFFLTWPSLSETLWDVPIWKGFAVGSMMLWCGRDLVDLGVVNVLNSSHFPTKEVCFC